MWPKLKLLFFFLKILESFAHHSFYYICSPPYSCTAVDKCQPTPNSYFPMRTLCSFGTACCIPSNTNSGKTVANNPETVATARVIRRNHKVLVEHKNFKFLPLDICGVVSTKLRITSGESCSPGEFPWMALIIYKSGNSTKQQDFRCAGTLINQNYVLTAAHCIDNSTILGVRLGEYNLLTDIDCDSRGQNCEPPAQDVLIQKIVIHSSYDSSTFANDIALIKMTNAANYSYENVRPICLPFGELLEADLTDSDMTIAGWGTTETGGKSSILRKVVVPVMSNDKCRDMYNHLKPITKNQICAGADEGRDACAGDSGGPLKRVDLINDSPRYIQYGIVSFGPTNCGLSTRPGIYTNIQKYMTWILDNLD